jgi:hypothetical protein
LFGYENPTEFPLLSTRQGNRDLSLEQPPNWIQQEFKVPSNDYQPNQQWVMHRLPEEVWFEFLPNIKKSLAEFGDQKVNSVWYWFDRLLLQLLNGMREEWRNPILDFLASDDEEDDIRTQYHHPYPFPIPKGTNTLYLAKSLVALYVGHMDLGHAIDWNGDDFKTLPSIVYFLYEMYDWCKLKDHTIGFESVLLAMPLHTLVQIMHWMARYALWAHKQKLNYNIHGRFWHVMLCKLNQAKTVTLKMYQWIGLTLEWFALDSERRSFSPHYPATRDIFHSHFTTPFISLLQRWQHLDPPAGYTYRNSDWMYCETYAAPYVLQPKQPKDSSQLQVLESPLDLWATFVMETIQEDQSRSTKDPHWSFITNSGFVVKDEPTLFGHQLMTIMCGHDKPGYIIGNALEQPRIEFEDLEPKQLFHHMRNYVLQEVYEERDRMFDNDLSGHRILMPRPECAPHYLSSYSIVTDHQLMRKEFPMFPDL